MKNLTVTYSIEVTEVMKNVDDCAEETVNSEYYKDALKNDAEEFFITADDITVKDFKVFVHDIPEQECESCKIE